jgi:diguanylate cyclase (GGDEF)-like protein
MSPSASSRRERARRDAAGRRRRIPRSALLAALVLVFGLGLSTASALFWRSQQSGDQRKAFDTTAADVTASIATRVRQDAEFLTTLNTVMTMHPHVSASAFAEWYRRLRGHEQQSGGIGTVVIEDVPVAELDSFQARRDADPRFLQMFGRWLRPVVANGSSRYCLISGGASAIPLTGMIAGLVQSNWCDPRTIVGSTEARLLNLSMDSAGLVIEPITSPIADTAMFQTAFYRRGMSLATAAERRRAVVGWVVSSFDVSALLRQSLGARAGGISASLYFSNPGARPVLIATGGRAGGRLARRTQIDAGGTWTVVVRGAPVGEGGTAASEAWLITGAGIVVAVLMALLLLTLTRSRERALAMVEEKTGELRHQATHDPLTGLPNRVLALDRAEQMLARARRSGRPIAALYVDVDGFKHVNDNFGHGAGDAILKAVADRLRTVIREGDTAARLAGDEFVVLLEGSDLDDGPDVVARRLLGALRAPYDLGPELGRPVTVNASIGVVYGLRESAADLLGDADVALYAAKQAGRNRFVVFEPGMQMELQDQVALELDIVGALDRGELFLVYEPLAGDAAQTSDSVEVLLRWRHPERGVLTAGEFIEIAERAGVAADIGRWVLAAACGDAAARRADGEELTIAVGLFAGQLRDMRLAEDVRTALAASRLDPAALTIGIGELLLVRDPERAARVLSDLKGLGVRLAVEGFGSTYGTFAQAGGLQFDTITLDPGFAHAAASAGSPDVLIHALVELGKSLTGDRGS